MRWTGEQRRRIYEQLAAMNDNFEQARESLARFRKLPGFERNEIESLQLLTAEARAACLSYLLNVVETAESDEAGSLQARRLRKERRQSARPT